MNFRSAYGAAGELYDDRVRTVNSVSSVARCKRRNFTTESREDGNFERDMKFRGSIKFNYRLIELLRFDDECTKNVQMFL